MPLKVVPNSRNNENTIEGKNIWLQGAWMIQLADILPVDCGKNESQIRSSQGKGGWNRSIHWKKKKRKKSARHRWNFTLSCRHDCKKAAMAGILFALVTHCEWDIFPTGSFPKVRTSKRRSPLPLTQSSTLGPQTLRHFYPQNGKHVEFAELSTEAESGCFSQVYQTQMNNSDFHERQNRMHVHETVDGIDINSMGASDKNA